MNDGGDNERLENPVDSRERMGGTVSPRSIAPHTLAFMSSWLYLSSTIAGISDYDLLVGDPIRPPLFGPEIGLVAFFVGGPALFWLAQLYMVRKAALIGGARTPADAPVHPLAQALETLATAASLVVAPVLLQLAFQYRFLAYQEEWITWWHRGFVILSLPLAAITARELGLTWRGVLTALATLVGALFGRAGGGSDDAPRFRRMAVWMSRIAAPSVIFAGLFVLTFPGELISRGLEVEGREILGRPAEILGVHNTLTPVWRPGVPVVAADAGDKAEPGPLPLDLRHRDFSHRNLRGLRLEGAEMDGVDISDSVVDGADLRASRLNDANLERTSLKGAHLEAAEFGGSDLAGSDLGDARLSDADLSGADLTDTRLIGTDLSGAVMAGTLLDEARLTDEQRRSLAARKEGDKEPKERLATQTESPPPPAPTPSIAPAIAAAAPALALAPAVIAPVVLAPMAIAPPSLPPATEAPVANVESGTRRDAAEPPRAPDSATALKGPTPAPWPPAPRPRPHPRVSNLPKLPPQATAF